MTVTTDQLAATIRDALDLDAPDAPDKVEAVAEILVAMLGKMLAPPPAAPARAKTAPPSPYSSAGRYCRRGENATRTGCLPRTRAPGQAVAGQPCYRGQSAAQTGCIPIAGEAGSGSGGSSDERKGGEGSKTPHLASGVPGGSQVGRRGWGVGTHPLLMLLSRHKELKSLTEKVADMPEVEKEDARLAEIRQGVTPDSLRDVGKALAEAEDIVVRREQRLEKNRTYTAALLGEIRRGKPLALHLIPDTHAAKVIKGVEAAAKWLEEFATGGKLDVHVSVTSGRPWYDEDTLHLRDESPVVAVHLLGHLLMNLPGAREVLALLDDYRLGKEKYVPLDKEFPDFGYQPGERGRRWPNPLFQGPAALYVGKPGELLPMSMEQLYTNPAHFARIDPDTFATIAGILTGTFQRSPLPSSL